MHEGIEQESRKCDMYKLDVSNLRGHGLRRNMYPEGMKS